MVGFCHPEAINLDALPLELGANARPNLAKIFLGLPGGGTVIARVFVAGLGEPRMKPARASQGNEHRTMGGQLGRLLKPPDADHDLSPSIAWVR